LYPNRLIQYSKVCQGYCGRIGFPYRQVFLQVTCQIGLRGMHSAGCIPRSFFSSGSSINAVSHSLQPFSKTAFVIRSPEVPTRDFTFSGERFIHSAEFTVHVRGKYATSLVSVLTNSVRNRRVTHQGLPLPKCFIKVTFLFAGRQQKIQQLTRVIPLH
jgi:hypothetical protein